MDEDKNVEVEEEKDVIIKEANLVAQQFQQMDEVAKTIIDDSDEDREKADELYDFMQDQIDVNNDKNPGTRDAMAKAMELKMKATDQKIELLKIKAKLINPNKGTAININLGEYDKVKGSDTNEMIDVVEEIKKKNGSN